MTKFSTSPLVPQTVPQKSLLQGPTHELGHALAVLTFTALLLVCVPAWAAVSENSQSTSDSANESTGAARIIQSRLWLPPSSDNLMDALRLAAQDALHQEDCKDVLYGRLNEYRTEHEEPTFTILCQKDPRTTFNLIYPVSQLLPDGSGPDNLTIDADDPGANLDALRQMLMLDDEQESANRPVNENTQNPRTPPQPTRQRERASDSLELDLDELLDTPAPQGSDNRAPVLF